MNSLGTIKAPRYSVYSVCESVWVRVENEKLKKLQYLTRTVADSRKALDLFATGTSHWRQTAAQRNKWKRERDREQESALGREREAETTDKGAFKKRSMLPRSPVKCHTPSRLWDKRGVQLYHTLSITQSPTHISTYVHTLLPLTWTDVEVWHILYVSKDTKCKHQWKGMFWKDCSCITSQRMATYWVHNERITRVWESKELSKIILYQWRWWSDRVTSKQKQADSSHRLVCKWGAWSAGSPLVN